MELKEFVNTVESAALLMHPRCLLSRKMIPGCRFLFAQPNPPSSLSHMKLCYMVTEFPSKLKMLFGFVTVIQVSHERGTDFREDY